MPTTVYSKTFTNSEGSWAGYHIRQVIRTADLTAAPGTNLIRLKLSWATASNNAGLSSLWVGNYGAGNLYNFNGNQVRITFNGGSNTITGITGATEITTDYVPFTSYNSAVTLVVAMFNTGTTAQLNNLSGTANVDYYYLGETDTQTGATAPTGVFTINGSAVLIKAIEMEANYVAGYSNHVYSFR